MTAAVNVMSQARFPNASLKKIQNFLQKKEKRFSLGMHTKKAAKGKEQLAQPLSLAARGIQGYKERIRIYLRDKSFKFDVAESFSQLLT